MKHTLKIFTLIAALLTMVACEKDNENPVNHERDITYTIAPAASAIDNATTTTIHLETEAEWQALLDRFCDYAEEGSEVTFYNANHMATKSATKDATTFSTTDREAMKRWMAQMEDEGKTVTVTFDSNTGTWNGTAYATAPSVGSGMLTLEADGLYTCAPHEGLPALPAASQLLMLPKGSSLTVGKVALDVIETVLDQPLMPYAGPAAKDRPAPTAVPDKKGKDRRYRQYSCRCFPRLRAGKKVLHKSGHAEGRKDRFRWWYR